VSNWTHSICETCWAAKNPRRAACRVNQTSSETCCFCGNVARSGIYVRANPNDTQFCKHEVKS
jgi:hypothetical protein